MNKIKSLFRIIKQHIPRKAAAAMIVAAAVIVPTAIFAWGPDRSTYTWERPADHVTFNSITDNPTYGDERDFVHIKEAGADSSTYAQNMKVQPGKTYDVFVYYHNNAASNLNNVDANGETVAANTGIGVAQGAYMRVEFPGTVNGSATGNVYIGADNASPKQVWDDIAFTSDSEVTMRIVPGSATIHNFGATNGVVLSDALFGASGTSLGYDSLNGVLPGCNEYSGYVTFQVTAVQPNFDMVKKVRKLGDTAWSKSVDINPGDTVEYLLGYTNTGSVNQKDVVLSDKLPAGMTYVAGSSQLKDANSPNGKAIADGVTTTGVNVGEYAPGGNVYVWFQAKAAANDDLPACGTNTLVNTGRADTPNGGKTDTADVVINKTCTTPKTPSYDLIKTVDKTTAKPGDTLTYTLTFKNTGEVDLTNAVVKDSLPSGLTYVTSSTTVDGAKANDGVTASGGLNIGTVAVGKTVVIKFQAKVNNDSVTATNCGDNSKTLTNKSSATTSEKQTEDRTDNNEASTVVTVTKTCTPNFDIAKTVDKKTAKPGDMIKYTLTFKNTGEVDLTNVIVKDVLPKNVTLSGDVTANPSTGVSGDLFGSDGLKIAKVETGKTVVITYSVKIAEAADLECGKTVLVNVVAAGASELAKEPDTSNNTATTEVEKDCTPAPNPCETNPSISADDESCKPCEYSPDMNYDNPNCVPPVAPIVNPPAPTPTPTPNTTVTSTAYTPEYIVATGPVGTFAGIIAAGALTFGGAAYLRSRRAVKNFTR